MAEDQKTQIDQDEAAGQPTTLEQVDLENENVDAEQDEGDRRRPDGRRAPDLRRLSHSAGWQG
jgi:hypothetical protein